MNPNVMYDLFLVGVDAHDETAAVYAWEKLRIWLLSGGYAPNWTKASADLFQSWRPWSRRPAWKTVQVTKVIWDTESVVPRFALPQHEGKDS